MNIPRKAVAFLTSAVSALTVLSVAAASTGGSRSCATANVRTVKIEDGELWWGAANFFGTNMPFSAKTRLKRVGHGEKRCVSRGGVKLRQLTRRGACLLRQAKDIFRRLHIVPFL